MTLREFREIKEFRENREFSLISLNSLTSLIFSTNYYLIKVFRFPFPVFADPLRFARPANFGGQNLQSLPFPPLS